MRPITPRRSNYFKKFGIYPLYYNQAFYEELISEYGQNYIDKFFLYSLIKAKESRKSNPTFNEQERPIWVSLFLKNYEEIERSLSKDPKIKDELIKELLKEYSNKSELSFLNKVTKELVLPLIAPATPELQIEEQLEEHRKNIKKLTSDDYKTIDAIIDKYSIYLRRGKTNKASICKKIEKECFKDKIVHIRQDYHEYDNFFDGHLIFAKIQKGFTDETKVKLLKNILDYFN